MSELKTLLTKLYDRGIRKIEMSWTAGGDDGYIEHVAFFPHDRRPSQDMKDDLREIAWNVYEDDYGGYTAGEFSCDGKVSIAVLPNGEYKANSENNYSEEGWDEETEEYETTRSDSEANMEVVLRV